MQEKLWIAIGVGVAVFSLLWKLVNRLGSLFLDDIRNRIDEHGKCLLGHNDRILTLENKVSQVEEDAKSSRRR